MDQVIVGQLEISPTRRISQLLVTGIGWFGGRDQPKLGIENVDQVIEVPESVGVTRCFEQLLA
jgi:hypothetical protein